MLLGNLANGGMERDRTPEVLGRVGNSVCTGLKPVEQRSELVQKSLELVHAVEDADAQSAHALIEAFQSTVQHAPSLSQPQRAHLLGTALCASARLAAATQRAERARASSRTDAAIRSAWRKSRAPPPANPTHSSSQASLPPSPAQHSQATESPPQQQQQTELQQEQQLLAQELGPLVDSVREVEGRVQEVSALSDALSSHISRQTEQIEQLYSEAVSSSGKLSQGNSDLSRAVTRSLSSRNHPLYLLLALSFALLILDAVSP